MKCVAESKFQGVVFCLHEIIMDLILSVINPNDNNQNSIFMYKFAYLNYLLSITIDYLS